MLCRGAKLARILIFVISIQTVILFVYFIPKQFRTHLEELRNRFILAKEGPHVQVQVQTDDPIRDNGERFFPFKCNFTDKSTIPFFNRTHHLLPDDNTYFVNVSGIQCMIHGTNLSRLDTNSSNPGQRKCPCLKGWRGVQCTIPPSVTNSNLPKHYNVTARHKPRRIIQAFPFNIEFEMLTARLHEIGPYVDLFMILESNYSAYGDPKPLRLLQRLCDGEFRQFVHKILYVFLGSFPKEGYKNGWIADNIVRDHIAMHGVKHQLTGYEDDDLFVMTDADELPERNTLLFMKLNNGYPIPIGYHLHQSTYGFFWAGRKQVHVISVVTMGFLVHVFQSHAIWIRSAPHHIQQQSRNVRTYLKAGGLVYPWSFGNNNWSAGWHCSWCCKPDCILTKLVSAQNGDFPRWGDYPEKRNIPYITKLVRDGTWFDDKGKMMKIHPNSSMFAPPYVIENPKIFHHLLVNEYIAKNKSVS